MSCSARLFGFLLPFWSACWLAWCSKSGRWHFPVAWADFIGPEQAAGATAAGQNAGVTYVPRGYAAMGRKR
jgi:hypothetical protein